MKICVNQFNLYEMYAYADKKLELKHRVRLLLNNKKSPIHPIGNIVLRT